MAVGRDGRRRLGWIVLGSVLAWAVAWTVWIATTSVDRGVAAGVVGVFVAIAALVVQVWGTWALGEPLPSNAAQADRLAATVRDQWRREAERRRLGDPQLLPLTWHMTRPFDTDGRGLHGVPVRLDGRLAGRFDEVARQLTSGFRQEGGRLVMIGEPGAGKTSLAILLTLGLIDARADGTATPVLLPVGAWDPVGESLDDWVVGTLATLHYNGRTDIPRRLLEARLLVPVLDGLDEIPESARRLAVRGINAATGSYQPLMVTCRLTEYLDVIEGGAPGLRRAALVRIEPVPAEDVVAYLSAVEWREGTDWKEIYACLRARPEAPVSTALSNPLMVSLARIVYERRGGSPAELLDADRFGSRHAVEDYLLDALVPALYEPDRLVSGRPAGARPRWRPAQAERWLTFLAQYLHRSRDRDLAWWQLSQRLSSAWVPPSVGIGAGLVVMAAVAAGVAVLGANTHPSSQAILGVGALVGAVFALVAMIVWYATPGRAPGRLSMSMRGSLHRLVRGFGVGLAVTGIPSTLVLASVAVGISLGDNWSFLTTESYLQSALATGAFVVVISLALALQNWIDAPPRWSTEASPLSFAQHDRRSALVGSLAAGALVSLFLAAAVLGGYAAGSGVSALLTGYRSPSDLQAAASTANTVTHPGSGLGLVVGAAFVLPGLVIAALILLTRAWPRFVVARLQLAVQGRLPWRLVTFLEEAKNRGLLRESGGAYQFRHVRLQELLANRPALATAASRRSPRIVAAVAGASLVALTAHLVTVVPRVDSFRALVGYDGSSQLAFSPSGRAVVSGSRIWNLDTPDDTGVPTGADDSVTSPDGAALATLGADRPVQVWDVSTRKPNDVLPVKASSATFGEDGRHLVTRTAAGLVQRWDLSGAVPEQLPGGFTVDGRGDVAMFTDSQGRTLATIDNSKTVRWWNLASGAPIGSPMTDVDWMEFSPDKRSFATVARGEVELWDLVSGAPVPGPALAHVQASTMQFSDDGTILAVADERAYVKVWFRATNRVVSVNVRTKVCILAFDPSGTILAVGSAYGGVQLREVSTGILRRSLKGHVDAVTAAAFSPDGATLATGSADSTVRLWKVP